MDFLSEGLGKRELVMGLDRAKLDREGETIILTGIVDAPADWAYKVTMEVGDWTNVLHSATSPQARQFLSTSVSVGKILGMGWWMVKFILLLAAYRLAKILGMGEDAMGEDAKGTRLAGAGAQKPRLAKAAHGGAESAS